VAANAPHPVDVTPVWGVPLPARPPAGEHPGRTGRPRADDLSRPAGPSRLRHRSVLVIGADAAFTGPAVTSPAAELAGHLAARAGAVTLLTGVPRLPGGRPEPRYRFGFTFREEPPGPAAPSVTRLRHRLPRRRTPSGRLIGEVSFASRGALASVGEPPDLVVAVTPGPGGAVAGARIAHRHGVPLLVVVHDLLGADPGRSAVALGRLERQALGRAARVAVTSETLRAAVRAYGVPADRVVVLPHATPPGPVVDQLTARRRGGWRTGAFLVAVPDPLSREQDLGVVLDAARRLGPRTELLLLARAGETEPLVERVGGHPRVHVVDTADERSRTLALAAADVLVVGEEPHPARPGRLPDVREGAVPGVLLECFRSGRPVVAAVDAAGPSAREITLSRGAGILVRPGDADLLTRAVAELRSDPRLRTVMGGAGLLHARHRLDRAAALLAVDALVDALCLDG